nr:MAG TPA: hypothetical protein [Caudoviricetes sp.]
MTYIVYTIRIYYICHFFNLVDFKLRTKLVDDV